MLEDPDFLKKEGKICYSQDASAYTWDGIINGLIIELDENNIYKVDKVANKVRKRC